MKFSLGQSETKIIEVDVLRYERAHSGDYEDDQWLTSQLRVSAGGFHGKVEAAIRTTELDAFLTQLRPLYRTLLGTAELSTMEGQLHFLLAGGGKGHIELTGKAEDRAGGDYQLHFRRRFDQTQLATSIHELERVVSYFPIR